MDGDTILTELISNSFTKSDLLRRVRILREYLEGKFFSKKYGSFVDFLKKTKISDKDLQILTKLSRKFLEKFTKSNVYTLTASLVKSAETADSIHVYLPKEFAQSDIDKLGSWFKKNLGNRTLIETQVDPTLVLGFAFVSNGVRHEFSYKYFWQKNRQEILKIIDRYVGKNNQ